MHEYFYWKIFAGKESHPLELTIAGFELLQNPPKRIGEDAMNVLMRGYEGYTRFDFMLGYTFIQASLSNFTAHNVGTALIDLAFTDKSFPDGKNQVEYFLDGTYGGEHEAVMVKEEYGLPKDKVRKVRKNFIVKKDGILRSDFRIASWEE
ncbi:hypothetical protein BGX26_002815 [Mortierella sp. AD094]|nr:hypothetical protein BGX26_002815 [Mortierella sp. AD094]